MKKNWGDNRVKKFCSEMWRNTVQGGSPIDTVECIWVNIWCMLDWIWSQNSRNTFFPHRHRA